MSLAEDGSGFGCPKPARSPTDPRCSCRPSPTWAPSSSPRLPRLGGWPSGSAGSGAAVRGHAAHCRPSGRTGPEDAVRRRHRAQSRRRGQHADLPGRRRLPGRDPGGHGRHPGPGGPPARGPAPAAQRSQERAQRDSGRAAGITAWLSISGQGEGLVISVTLDDPASLDAHQEVLDAVQRAVAAAPAQGFPIDVTFPGENEPDQVDAWISAYAEPFYIRA